MSTAPIGSPHLDFRPILTPNAEKETAKNSRDRFPKSRKKKIDKNKGKYILTASHIKEQKNVEHHESLPNPRNTGHG
jgi:hypothetical protein